MKLKKYFNIWVLFTITLYYYGPVDWEGRKSVAVLWVVLPCLLCFNVGALAGSHIFVQPWSKPPFLKRHVGLTAAVLALHVVLSAISVYKVTGLWMYNPSSYFLNFGDVYSNFGEVAANLQANGIKDYVFIISKAVIFSLSLYALVIYFNESLAYRIIFFFPLAASSLLRGTDKEFIDIFIIFFLLYIYKGERKIPLWPIITSILVVLYFFVERRISRFDGNIPDCLPEGGACFNFNSWVATNISPTMEVLWIFLTNYITQGYEALSLAVRLPFEPNYGVGHLPLLKSVLCSVIHLGCGIGDFQQKLTDMGWNVGSKWTSVYPIIANDTNWYFLWTYFLYIGILFGLSDRLWRKYEDDISLIVIIIITIFFVYSSANMQIAISFDWLVVTLAFFSIQTARIFLVTKRSGFSEGATV